MRSAFSITTFLTLILAAIVRSSLPLGAQPPATIFSLSWSSDGTMLAMGGVFDGQRALRIFDQNKQLIQEFYVDSGPTGVSWHPDNNRVAAVVSDYTIWNLDTGQIEQIFPKEGASRDDSLYWNPLNTNQVANAMQDRIQIRDLTNGQILQTMDRPGGNPDTIVGMGWSLDGTKIYAGSTDGVVTTWDTNNGILLHEAFFQDWGVAVFALSPDATRFAVLGQDDRATVVDTNTYQVLVETETIADSDVTNLIWYSDGSRIAAIDPTINTSRIYVWNAVTGEHLYSQVPMQERVFRTSVDFSPNGSLTLSDRTGGFVLGPIPHASSDQTVTDSDNNGSENVMLDGSASSDSDGTITSYVWTLDGAEIATGAAPTVELPVGTHTITLTVIDDDGAISMDTVTITVNAPPADDD